MKKSIIAVAALAVLAVATPAFAQQQITVSIHTDTCAAYRGGWAASNAIQTRREPGHVTCTLTENVGAECTMTTGNGSVWRFSGSFRENEKGLMVEAYDDTGRTLQLGCPTRTYCLGFRVFNVKKQMGFACIPDEI